jgi:hypothetical protein
MIDHYSRMARLIGLHFLLGFVLLGCITLSLRGEEPVWIPKEARQYQLIEDKGTDSETFTMVTICPMGNDKFYVAVQVLNKHESEFDGMGKLEKDGWIHFFWSDNFRRKGRSAVRFLDYATKVAIDYSDNNSANIYSYSCTVPWTRKPVLADVRTAPHGYLVHLPVVYQNRDEGFNYITLWPQREGKVRIIVYVRLTPQGENSNIVLRSTGTWKDGDLLVFSFVDELAKDRGQGVLHFLSADKVILTLTYSFTNNPARKAQAREFNAKQLPLLRDEDYKPWEIAGMDEAVEIE